MRGVLFDTEVNSLDAKECIELAFCPVDLTDGVYSSEKIITSRHKPTQPFEAGAVAVHYIGPDDVKDCPPSADAKLPDCEYLIAHNVDFDCEVLKIESGKRICTLALSRHLWPEFKAHTLSAMVLELFGMEQITVDLVKGAHAADADVSLKQMLLGKIIAKTQTRDMEDLYRLSEVARVPTVWSFGKHKGLAIADTPRDYIRWMLRQADVDKYLKKALQAAL